MQALSRGKDLFAKDILFGMSREVSESSLEGRLVVDAPPRPQLGTTAATEVAEGVDRRERDR